MISAFFNKSKSYNEAAELNLVDYIIHRSKINCNYLKLVELIQKTCKIDDEYSDNFEVNFYPVRKIKDFFGNLKGFLKILDSNFKKFWAAIENFMMSI